MVKYMVCILTSGNLPALKLSYQSATDQNAPPSLNYDIFIIVNTLNKGYYNEVISYFNELENKPTKIIQTESNGKPGKGHNSLIDVFSYHPSYDRLIMIDGDDLMYPDFISSIDYIYSVSDTDTINLAGNSSLKLTNTQINGGNDSKYTLSFQYDITENLISRISPDFNDILATPSRMISMNRNILPYHKENTFYDTDCKIYDDYKAFLVNYNQYISENKRFKVHFISCKSLYLYMQLDNKSISKNESTCDSNDKVICKQIMKDLSIDKLVVQKIKVQAYDFKDINLDGFYSKTLYRSVNSINFDSFDFMNDKKRIMFIDSSSEFSYETIKINAMGGTQSAIYSLSKQLSSRGFSVCVLTKATYKSSNGSKVSNTLSYNTLNDVNIKTFNPDIIVFQGILYKNYDYLYNTLISKSTKLYLWHHHDINVHFLNKSIFHPEIGNVFVSNWQKNRYIHEFNLDHDNCYVMQNGVSDTILSKYHTRPQKQKTLVYISSPYRGLMVAYHMFKAITEVNPEVRLKVFSCFNRDKDKHVHWKDKQYNPIINKNDIPCSNDLDKYYKPLYELLVNDPNVDYYGSIPQNVLSQHLNDSMVLFYPNTFPETCCTSVLEAMAHRCNIVTSDLGALSETTNGFAALYNPIIDVLDVSYNPDNAVYNPIKIEQLSKSYIKQFIEKTLYFIKNYHSEQNQRLLEIQERYISDTCTWEKRARIFTEIIA